MISKAIKFKRGIHSDNFISPPKIDEEVHYLEVNRDIALEFSLIVKSLLNFQDYNLDTDKIKVIVNELLKLTDDEKLTSKI